MKILSYSLHIHKPFLTFQNVCFSSIPRIYHLQIWASHSLRKKRMKGPFSTSDHQINREKLTITLRVLSLTGNICASICKVWDSCTFSNFGWRCLTICGACGGSSGSSPARFRGASSSAIRYNERGWYELSSWIDKELFSFAINKCNKPSYALVHIWSLDSTLLHQPSYERLK